MNSHLRYWWNPHLRITPSVTEKYFKVYYDDQGRDTLVEEYGPDHKLMSVTRLNWGRWDQVKIQRDDSRPLGKYRRWLWKTIERFLMQHAFRRPWWKKAIYALCKPDFLIRSDGLDANGNLQEYFLFVYFPDGSLAGVDQYQADGMSVKFLPME